MDKIRNFLIEILKFFGIIAAEYLVIMAALILVIALSGSMSFWLMASVIILVFAILEALRRLYGKALWEKIKRVGRN